MITEKAYAKINLKLNILGKRPDGYHEVDMIMQTLAWYDGVFLDKNSQGGIILTSNLPEMCNEQNLAWQAAALLAKEAGIEPKVRIVLQKQIFIAAGLGGGSADAAAVLRGCNKLWKLGYDNRRLETIAAQLGSDIPFLIEGGRARATGRGEILTPLPDIQEDPLKRTIVVLAKPRDFDISTKWAYQAYDAWDQVNTTNTDNVLELPVFHRYPILASMKQTALKAGASYALMTGSGPTIFAFVKKNFTKAFKVAAALKKFNADTNISFFQERIK